MIAFLAMLFVSYKDVSALTYSSSAELEFTFLPTITITFSPNTGFIINDLSAGNSAYSNTVTVSASSNSSDGFILSATVGKTNDNNRNNNRLVHSNNTDYFEGIATNASLTLNNLGSNKWGYSTYDTTNEEWSDYSGLATIGNTGTTLITTDTSGTTELDMKIGASAAVNQVAGAFTNDINFTATANVVTYDYTITFASNNSSTVANMPTNIANASYNTGGILQISSTTPTADGYTFLGWCGGTVSGTTCTGNLYQPGDYLKLDNASSSTTNNIILNAVWQFNGIYMQDMTLADCSPEGIVVYDKRDDTPYTVKKLADNKCWMLDNLALDLTALTQAQLYGTGNDAGKMTNASNEALGYLKGATTGTASDKWAMTGVTKNWTADYSYSQPWIAVDSTTSGGCSNAYCVDGGAAGSPWSYDSVTSETINGVTSIAQGKIGVYYNYCAASAGSYCWGGTGISSTGSPSSDPVADSIRDITDDICPYKWRLPTGGSTGEFQYLYSQYSGGSPSQVAAFQTALSTPLSGHFYSGKAYSQGNGGNFWSSTWYTTLNMYRLVVNSSNVNPSDRITRYYGYSVRCILAE